MLHKVEEYWILLNPTVHRGEECYKASQVVIQIQKVVGVSKAAFRTVYCLAYVLKY